MAFIERMKKFNKANDAENAMINMEYLKNCIVRFMSSTEISEKKKIFPAISTILKFTQHENETISLAIEKAPEEAIQTLSAFAANSLQGFFYGSNNNNSNKNNK